MAGVYLNSETVEKVLIKKKKSDKSEMRMVILVSSVISVGGGAASVFIWGLHKVINAYSTFVPLYQ